MINTSKYKNVTSVNFIETIQTHKLRVSVVSNNEHIPVCLYNDLGDKFVIKSPGLTIEVLLKSLYGMNYKDLPKLLNVNSDEAVQLLTRLYNLLCNEEAISRNNLGRLLHFKELISNLVNELRANRN